MKKIKLKSRKLLRTLFGGVSLTAAAFVFQACYGPPLDYDDTDVWFTGKVRSQSTSLPVKGIKVIANDDGYNFGITDDNGEFNFYTTIPNRVINSGNVRYTPDSVRVSFTDMDGPTNGLFRDTTIVVNASKKNEVFINLELREIQ